eukprot:Rmarinus@m.24827
MSISDRSPVSGVDKIATTIWNHHRLVQRDHALNKHRTNSTERKDIVALNSRLLAKDDEINELKAHISRLEDALHSSRSQLNGTIEDFERQNDLLRSDLDSLELANADLVRENRLLRDRTSMKLPCKRDASCQTAVEVKDLPEQNRPWVQVSIVFLAFIFVCGWLGTAGNHLESDETGADSIYTDAVIDKISSDSEPLPIGLKDTLLVLGAGEPVGDEETPDVYDWSDNCDEKLIAGSDEAVTSEVGFVSWLSSSVFGIMDDGSRSENDEEEDAIVPTKSFHLDISVDQLSNGSTKNAENTNLENVEGNDRMIVSDRGVSVYSAGDAEAEVCLDDPMPPALEDESKSTLLELHDMVESSVPKALISDPSPFVTDSPPHLETADILDVEFDQDNDGFPVHGVQSEDDNDWAPSQTDVDADPGFRSKPATATTLDADLNDGSSKSHFDQETSSFDAPSPTSEDRFSSFRPVLPITDISNKSSEDSIDNDKQNADAPNGISQSTTTSGKVFPDGVSGRPVESYEGSAQVDGHSTSRDNDATHLKQFSNPMPKTRKEQ